MGSVPAVARGTAKMINLNFSIEYPFSDRFKILASTSKMLTQHKAVEANIYGTANIIKLLLTYSIRQDHAGIRIEFGLFGYECELYIYDTRHWDYENNCWNKHTDH
jgi:hypothetical protein